MTLNEAIILSELAIESGNITRWTKGEVPKDIKATISTLKQVGRKTVNQTQLLDVVRAEEFIRFVSTNHMLEKIEQDKPE